VWWAGRQPLDIYLGTRAAAICRGNTRLWSTQCNGFNEGLGLLRSELHSGDMRQRIRVWLSGGLCRPFVMPAVDGVRNSIEARRIAHAMAPSATGLQGSCEVWVEDRRQAGSRIAVAMSDNTLKALLDLSGDRRSRVVSIKPWWCEVLRATLAQSPRPAAIGVRDCDSVTILLGDGDEFEMATTVAPVQDAESARTAFARAALSSSVEIQNALSVALHVDGEPEVEQADRMALGCLAVMSK
jgi:hypothetical protein